MRWTKTPKERFVDKFEVGNADECWLWKATKDTEGYGRIRWVDGKMEAAHRVAWMLMNGVIPDGLSVLHSCDCPACVNPNHLFLGTQQDNVRDMFNKQREGNHRRGETNGRAKLVGGQVEEVRRLRATGQSLRKIAKAFHISFAHVRRICFRKAWAHLAVDNLSGLR